MGSRWATAVLLALAPACASPLLAQRRQVSVLVVPLTAIAIHDLSFGTVLPGIPVSVSTSDPMHAGQFEVEGPPAASVRVEFTLPAVLTSGGNALPVFFGGADGFADFSHDTPPHSVVFDPHTPLIGTLGTGGLFFLKLGGTVSPSRVQIGGAYSATISITVYNLGS